MFGRAFHLQGKGWRRRRRKTGRRNIRRNTLHWGYGDRGATGMERDEGLTRKWCLAPETEKGWRYLILIRRRMTGEEVTGSEGEGIWAKG
ncbi:uncharacterized protein MONOS_13994 [Monocercomonoides exilis]|uniref:uncharacterized protein n=1 Tax=Monocercomonoides exilis TaxID=2049356 RepID=UPI0035599CD4|nr:hypothetical protein MONOS_17155 [Monocercomonoides exilis]KAH7829251.1 hypothetical protein MONOS_13994 [Monocercomonoides exilis]|eukprot:MONOS_13994.1-p1 / transcript=MONOS_13994.1 / gene=MONOS_13994 / organism=Monocercomonoides_exilis_PA203 / gene_product=unspecified product / transcript_product=unspecified product / location=Mono_scaffold00918:17690-18456(-) / protein_length=90 / sequence_SO=supercontig / SO=protein_coding / is_pseudo=false